MQIVSELSTLFKVVSFELLSINIVSFDLDGEVLHVYSVSLTSVSSCLEVFLLELLLLSEDPYESFLLKLGLFGKFLFFLLILDDSCFLEFSEVKDDR